MDGQTLKDRATKLLRSRSGALVTQIIMSKSQKKCYGINWFNSGRNESRKNGKKCKIEKSVERS